jgi:hypothetical protein
MPHGRGVQRFRSSDQKEVVRKEFQARLIRNFQKRKQSLLKYFGLPGDDALDLKEWGDIVEEVVAVEFHEGRLRLLRERLEISYSHIRCRTHHGDADNVILNNGSDSGSGWQYASEDYNIQAQCFYWGFDVVYLDYYGAFLPYDRGQVSVENRARALRHLFAVDREDAWQPWLLMVTVESTLCGNDDRVQMRNFLAGLRSEVDSETSDAISFLLTEGLEPEIEAERLVHGTLARLVGLAASNADVRVTARPVVLYTGYHGTPMLHFAYECVPRGTTFGPSQDLLSLLRAPVLTVREPAVSPWFALLGDQVPGATSREIARSLDFLPLALARAIPR